MPDAHESCASGSESGWVTITVSHRKHNYTFELAEDATVTDLFDEIAAALDIPVAHQKILVPKGPLLKSPFKQPSIPLTSLQGKTLTLLGCGAAEVQAVQDMSEKVAQRNAARMAQKAKMKHAQRRSQPRSSPEDAKYNLSPGQAAPGPAASRDEPEAAAAAQGGPGRQGRHEEAQVRRVAADRDGAAVAHAGHARGHV
ncbi:hypothetical protein J3459_018482 [Metarhizium acridum]|nr:hypothetical protein J3459_018482 [Metarhizium acridum]